MSFPKIFSQKPLISPFPREAVTEVAMLEPERRSFVIPAEAQNTLCLILLKNDAGDTGAIDFAFPLLSSLPPEQQERNLRVAFQLAEWQVSSIAVASALLDGVEPASVKGHTEIYNILINHNKIAAFSCDFKREDQISYLRSLYYQTAISYEVILIIAAEDLIDLPSLVKEGQAVGTSQALRAQHVTSWILMHFGFEKDGRELQDLGLLNAEPERFQQVEELFIATTGGLERKDALAYLAGQAHTLSATLTAEGYPHQIKFRLKSTSSAHNKLQIKQHIRDCLAMRCITKSSLEADCYFAHTTILTHFVAQGWEVEADFHRDYIRTPKPNGYKSLHDLLCNPATGALIEIQTRTDKMDRTAEFGDANHAEYKTGEQHAGVCDDPQSRNYIFSYKQQNMEQNGVVIVYDNQGNLHKLVSESSNNRPSVLDLAFSVSIATGLQASEALIDGQRAMLGQPLLPGQTVSIITGSKAQFHARSKLVQTSLAKAVIKAAIRAKNAPSLQAQDQRHLIEIGRRIVDRFQAELGELDYPSFGVVAPSKSQVKRTSFFSSHRQAELLYPLERIIQRKGFADIDEFCLVLALLEPQEQEVMLGRLRTRTLNQAVLLNMLPTKNTAVLEFALVDKPGAIFALFKSLDELGLTITYADQRPMLTKPPLFSSVGLAALRIEVSGWQEETAQALRDKQAAIYNELPGHRPLSSKAIILRCAIQNVDDFDPYAEFERLRGLTSDRALLARSLAARTREKVPNPKALSDTFIELLAEISHLNGHISTIQFTPKKDGLNCEVVCCLPKNLGRKKALRPAKDDQRGQKDPGAEKEYLSDCLEPIAGLRRIIIS